MVSAFGTRGSFETFVGYIRLIVYRLFYPCRLSFVSLSNRSQCLMYFKLVLLRWKWLIYFRVSDFLRGNICIFFLCRLKLLFFHLSPFVLKKKINSIFPLLILFVRSQTHRFTHVYKNPMLQHHMGFWKAFMHVRIEPTLQYLKNSNAFFSLSLPIFLFLSPSLFWSAQRQKGNQSYKRSRFLLVNPFIEMK